jgi:hypothetical protein
MLKYPNILSIRQKFGIQEILELFPNEIWAEDEVLWKILVELNWREDDNGYYMPERNDQGILGFNYFSTFMDLRRFLFQYPQLLKKLKVPIGSKEKVSYLMYLLSLFLLFDQFL